MPDLDYRQKAWSVGLIVLFFAGWELFCLMTGMSDLVLPRPSQILVTLVQKFPLLWPHILQTLATTMIGFVLGVVLGVVLGAIIGVSKTAYDTATRCWSASPRFRKWRWCRSSCCGSAPARCRRC